ncbi:MAG: hypothetical protein AB7O24_32105 [Kofleriaceae bacterium]
MRLPWLVVSVAVTAGCLPPLTRSPNNVVDLKYRSAAAPRATATALYHWGGSRSLAITSRCKMAPTDSEMYAARAEHCGGIAAWYWGVSRVLLEHGGSPTFLTPLRSDGRLRWLDLPGACR